MSKSVEQEAVGAAPQVKEVLQLHDEFLAELVSEIAIIVDKSNQAYGNSTEKSAEMMAILWPDGIPPDRMHDARVMISVLDKLSRIATDKNAFGESPWRDAAGYCVLGYKHDVVTKTLGER